MIINRGEFSNSSINNRVIHIDNPNEIEEEVKEELEEDEKSLEDVDSQDNEEFQKIDEKR